MCLAVPGEIIKIEGESLDRQATVSFAGIERKVNLAFTPEANLGDFVIVHAGVAISVVKPQLAIEIQKALESSET